MHSPESPAGERSGASISIVRARDTNFQLKTGHLDRSEWPRTYPGLLGTRDFVTVRSASPTASGHRSSVTRRSADVSRNFSRWRERLDALLTRIATADSGEMRKGGSRWTTMPSSPR